MMNEGFRIIAVKPLPGCASNFLKVLKEDYIYYFDKSYRIEPDKEYADKEIITAYFFPFPDLYKQGKLKINVSAVVGQNGSGKSTLMELFYVAIYNLSLQLEVLPKEDEEGEEYDIVPNIKMDLYFSEDGRLFKLRFEGSVFMLYHFAEEVKTAPGAKEIKYKQTSDATTLKKKEELEPLFFSIVLNYSQYALNTREMGKWIKPIFHKNDAYQTPIVLNPFRKDGNIDINTENDLVRSRLLANILSKEEGIDKLIMNLFHQKTPGRLKFSLNYSKFPGNRNIKDPKDLDPLWLSKDPQSQKILQAIFDTFWGKEVDLSDDSLLNRYAKQYILQKAFSITQKYTHYEQFKDFGTNEDTLSKYLAALKRDLGHITYKLRQAIYFLACSTLDHQDRTEFDDSVKDIADRINRKRSAKKEEGLELRLMDMVPPSFFKVDIEFENTQNMKDGKDHFSKFSSGEKQRIYSLSSLVYHLRNLDSVQKDTADGSHLIKYQNVNIVFDEIELYYHPEFQRTFLADLLESLNLTTFAYIGSINFIFITHSPFILSDIPKHCVLFLEAKQELDENKLVVYKAVDKFAADYRESNKGLLDMNSVYDLNTFGGNIHDLLGTSFFLQGGFMGEFANKKINALIDYLSPDPTQKGGYNEWDNMDQPEEKIKKFIDMIGEPLIKDSLRGLYDEKFPPLFFEIQKEIDRLEELKEKIRNR